MGRAASPTTIRELIERRRARAGQNGRPGAGDRACGFCGEEEAPFRERLLPRTVRIGARCGACPRLAAGSEEIRACAVCHLHKRGRGLYELYRMRFPFDRRFADRIPPALELRYLDALAACHDCARTLDERDIDGDGRLTVFDIDFVLHRR